MAFWSCKNCRRRDRSAKRRGNVVVLSAAFMAIAIGFLAFAMDIGHITTAQAELQNAADAAAMAGARGLRDSPAQCRTSAKQLAEANEVASASILLIPEQDVEIGNWDEQTATFTVLASKDEAQGNAVRVTCRCSDARGNRLKLFFAPIFGRTYADTEASAIAKVETTICGLIIGLDKFTMSGSSHTDSYNSDVAPYAGATAGLNGHACSNTTIKMSGSTAIGGDAHPGPDETVDSSSSVGVLGKIEPLKEPLTMPPVNPGDAATVNNNADIPLSIGGENPLNGANFTLSGGDHVDLPPGTYYFEKFTLSGGSSVGISGETVVYVTTKVAISGGSVVNARQLPSDFQLYPMAGDCKISGDSEMYAVVYGPNAKVERSGSSGYYGMIVGRELVLSGDGGIHADEALDILAGSEGEVRLVK